MAKLSALDALQAKFDKAIKQKHKRKSKSINWAITILPKSIGYARVDFNGYGIARKCPKRRK